jgi:hypothetical protein
MKAIENILPSKQSVLNSLCELNVIRFTTRNNQHIITVSLNDYFKASEIAKTFGNADTIAQQEWVKIKIA